MSKRQERVFFEFMLDSECRNKPQPVHHHDAVPLDTVQQPSIAPLLNIPLVFKVLIINLPSSGEPCLRWPCVRFACSGPWYCSMKVFLLLVVVDCFGFLCVALSEFCVVVKAAVEFGQTQAAEKLLVYFLLGSHTHCGGSSAFSLS